MRSSIVFTSISILIQINEIYFTQFPTKTIAITDAQRAEVQKLRHDLNQGFEKYDVQAKKGIIVQPGWTQSDVINEKIDVKVKVTDAALKETLAIRSEINKAVSQDTFKTSVSNYEAANAKALDHKFLMQQADSKRLDNQVSSIKHIGTDFVGISNTDDTKNEPNFVEAIDSFDQDIDVRKLQRLEISKRRTKEVLQLTSIVEDYKFNLGDDVLQWEHILHAGKQYFIGRREKDFYVILQTNDSYVQDVTVKIDQPISYMETYTHWNFDQRQYEGIVLIATADKIRWYRANNVTDETYLDWEWNVGKTITGLTYFSSESNEYLTVSTNESSRTGYFALNIYQFSLKDKEFWIAQQMQMSHPCSEVTIHFTGRDLILAIAQNNTAAIYTYNPDNDNDGVLRFRLRRTYQSANIKLIACFQMGGRSYIALGGHSPQILFYHDGDFIPKTILGNNYGNVELFFPIPAHTYRDDMILLVQHRVDFATHHVIALEALIWDGEAFVASIPPPCHMDKHVVYGVGCMLDIQRDEGLLGAVLLRRGNEISILVPRHNVESGLFQLNMELLARNSELLDLQEIWKFLKEWVEEHENSINTAIKFVQTPNAHIIDTVDFSNLETLETPSFSTTGDIGAIYLNNYKWTDDDTGIQLHNLIQTIEIFAQNLQNPRKKRSTDENHLNVDTLEVKTVEAIDMDVELLNNEIFFINTNKQFGFNGSLNLVNLSVLKGVFAKKRRENPELIVDGDLSFEEINDIQWLVISENIVLRTQPIGVIDLVVDGEIVVEQNLTVDALNALSFPGEYLWSSGPYMSIVRAEKDFKGMLMANAVDTDGLMNAASPFDIITLNDPQEWPGTQTFRSLEITEKLQLNGRASPFADKNPTLLESKSVKAACNFKYLIVNGPIVLNGDYDNEEVLTTLRDIVKNPTNQTSSILIPSKKSFHNLILSIDLHIIDDRINSIPIDEFVTLHTEQELYLSTLWSYIFFNNLTIAGNFDDVNITELLENSIKIDVPQNLTNSTQFNFAHSIDVNLLYLNESLNAKALSNGYQTVYDDLYVPIANFHNINAKSGNIASYVDGAQMVRLNCLSLENFFNSMTTNETNLMFNQLILADSLETEKCHNINSKYLLSFLEKINDIPEMILAGEICVDQIIVTDSVQLKLLNDQFFDEDIQMTAVWLNRPNFLNTELKFRKLMHVHDDIVVKGDYNGLNLPKTINDMIFRYKNSTTIIWAPKSFLQPIHVLNNTDVHALNGVLHQHIANKLNENYFNSTLQINGNLLVNNLDITGDINKFPIKNVKKLVRFDDMFDIFILCGQIKLSQRMQLNDLSVLNNFNTIANLSNFFESLVFKNQVTILYGNITFSGRCSIINGLSIEILNDIQIAELFNNIIFKDSEWPVYIYGLVEFGGQVNATQLIVGGHVRGDNLSGSDFEEWFEESLRVDQSKNIDGESELLSSAVDGNLLLVTYLNDNVVDEIFTLKTSQNFTKSIKFGKVILDDDIRVHGKVNDIDLQKEYENTMLIYGNQYIQTPLTIPLATVLKNLYINATVNNSRNFQKIATLNTEKLKLTSSIYFQSLTINNLQTNYTISSIDLIQWITNSLWLKLRTKQRITGTWNIRNLKVKQINDSTNPANQVDNKMRTMTDVNDKVELESFNKRQQNHTNCLKYIEEKFKLILTEWTKAKIQKVFILNQKHKNYLLINTCCKLFIWKWNHMNAIYDYFNSIESGGVNFISLLNNTDVNLQFLTYASAKHTNCPHNNTSIKQLIYWNVTETSFVRKIIGNISFNNLWNLTIIAESKNRSFIDTFKPLIQRIINDLNHKLELEMMMAQQSNLESDVYAEHLYAVFLAIMHELQQLVSFKVMTNFNRNTFNVLENRGNFLAARTIQLIWPVIVQINEIYEYTHEKNDNDIPACILQMLEHVINDVLFVSIQESSNTNASLIAVIERIHKFQLDLKKLQEELDKQFYRACNDRNKVFEFQCHFENTPNTILSNAKRFKKILSFKVDDIKSLHPAYAVIAQSMHNRTAVNIEIYNNTHDTTPMQTFSTSKPHSLCMLYIRPNILIAYIDGCCSVNILHYRDQHGFVTFAKFQTATKIYDLLSLNLLQANVNLRRYFFATVHSHTISYYEIIISNHHHSIISFNKFDCN